MSRLDEAAGEARRRLERSRALALRAASVAGQCTERGAAALTKLVASEEKFYESLAQAADEVAARDRSGDGDETEAERLEASLAGSNLGRLEVVVAEAEAAAAVVASGGKVELLKSFRAPGGRVAAVDVVAGGGARWVRVKAASPWSVQREWNGHGSGRPALRRNVEALLACSRAHPLRFVPPAVELLFAAGVTDDVAADLEAMGATVRGERVAPDDRLRRFEEEWEEEVEVEEEATPQAAAEQMAVTPGFNLDTTTLLVLCSDLTNGRAPQSFVCETMRRMLAEERAAPAREHLLALLGDAPLVACETAAASFAKIARTIGGPRERARAEELMRRVRVVPDAPSARAAALLESATRKITRRNVVTFGTGDSLRMVTVTANRAFVVAAAALGVDFAVQFHHARALSETFKARHGDEVESDQD